MFREMPRFSALAVLTAAGLLASACVVKDPKFSTASIPDAALAHDAMIMIGSNGSTTTLKMPPSLCADPRFGRPAEPVAAGAVSIPCWDGS